MTSTPPDRHALDLAYRKAAYRVETTPPLQLSVDQPEPRLDALLQALGVTTAALLTAENPASRRSSPAGNRAANDALRSRLRESGLRWIAADSSDPAGDWPEEAGMLVLGIDAAAACGLAGEFGQNAFLWCEAGAAPRLAWTQDQVEALRRSSSTAPSTTATHSNNTG